MSNWHTVYRSRNKQVLRRNDGKPPLQSDTSPNSDDWPSSSTLLGGGLILIGLLADGFTGIGMILMGGMILFKIW